MKKTILNNKEMSQFRGGETSWGKEYSVTTTCSDGSNYTDFCAGDGPTIANPRDIETPIEFKFDLDIRTLDFMELNHETVYFLP